MTKALFSDCYMHTLLCNACQAAQNGFPTVLVSSPQSTIMCTLNLFTFNWKLTVFCFMFFTFLFRTLLFISAVMSAPLPSVPTEEPQSLRSRFFSRGHALEAAPEASTALASLHHSACIVIDMGNYVLSECRNRAYTTEDAALPCIAGEHVRQILPEALVERAALFPPLDPASQV